MGFIEKEGYLGESWNFINLSSSQLKPSWQSSAILQFFVAFVIPPIAFAQPHLLQFQHLSGAQGLSNNRAWAFTQDRRGLVMIQIQEKAKSRYVTVALNVINEGISTLNAPLDYTIELAIEDLYKTQQNVTDALKDVCTRFPFALRKKHKHC